MEALGCLFPAADYLSFHWWSKQYWDHPASGAVGTLKSENIRTSCSFGQCYKKKKKKKLKSIYTDIRKQTYNWVLEIISPQSLKNTKTKHMFSITFVLLHSYNLQVQTLNNCSFLKRSQYKHNCLFSACSTSTSCMDTMSTPHFVPLSTNAESKESMTTTVLRTGVWPFSRVCSRVSALFWLSHSTVEISAERLKNLELHYQWNNWLFHEASSCTRLKFQLSMLMLYVCSFTK